jgi:hypothetical protein
MKWFSFLVLSNNKKEFASFSKSIGLTSSICSTLAWNFAGTMVSENGLTLVKVDAKQGPMNYKKYL